MRRRQHLDDRWVALHGLGDGGIGAVDGDRGDHDTVAETGEGDGGGGLRWHRVGRCRQRTDVGEHEHGNTLGALVDQRQVEHAVVRGVALHVGQHVGVALGTGGRRRGQAETTGQGDGEQHPRRDPKAAA